jgi:Holliday junction resolvasome RuvABC endonuclease subunit
MKKAYYLGIDQSFTSCGVVVLNEKQKVIEATTIKTSKDDNDIFDRAWFIAESISSNFINKYAPEIVGLEGLAFSKFGDATRDLAGLQFTLVNYIRHMHTYDSDNLLIVSPNELKKFATTKGNAKKEQMVDSLPKNVLESFQKQNYKKTTGLYDVTDAYWIARYTIEVSTKRKPEKSEPKYQVFPSAVEPVHFTVEQIESAVKKVLAETNSKKK